MRRRILGMARHGVLALLVPNLLACAGLERPASGIGDPGSRRVALGIEHRVLSPWPASRVHVVQIDLRAPGVVLALSPPAERGQRIDTMAATPRAAVSFNASFFDRRYTPRGLTVSEGRAWDEVLAADASPLLGCDVRLVCAIRFDDTGKPDARWFTTVAGTPWLVRGGQPRGASDDATCSALCANLHPRTAIGLKGQGRWLMVVMVEGRREGARGVSLAQLAALMASLGVQDAINLDGGGSSTLWLHGKAVMGRPANEPAERPLANAVHVFSRPPQPLPTLLQPAAAP